MPDTGFTCRDKILGGYYADPETQCQMFHICVKVSGVGVSEKRKYKYVQNKKLLILDSIQLFTLSNYYFSLHQINYWSKANNIISRLKNYLEKK